MKPIKKLGLAGAFALAVLAASSRLPVVWVLPENAEMRLTGDTLSSFAHDHPPKPWRGFKVEVLGVSIDGQERITTRLSGPLIQTPIEITGAPEYDAVSTRS